jgi:hypothetical protein
MGPFLLCLRPFLLCLRPFLLCLRPFLLCLKAPNPFISRVWSLRKQLKHIKQLKYIYVKQQNKGCVFKLFFYFLLTYSEHSKIINPILRVMKKGEKE